MDNMAYMTKPQANIISEIQTDGRVSLRTMLLGTSNNEYGMKNNVTAMLYWFPVRWRSVPSPATLALPTSFY